MEETDGRLGEESLNSFHLMLYRASQAQRSCLGPQIAELGLGTGQPKVLTYLAVRGPSPQRAIAEFFDNDPGTISRMIDSLERGGFVSIAPGKDKRTKMVSLTQKGLDAAMAWEACCEEEQRMLLEDFSPEELDQLEDYLGRICDVLRAAQSRAGSRGGEAQ